MPRVRSSVGSGLLATWTAQETDPSGECPDRFDDDVGIATDLVYSFGGEIKIALLRRCQTRQDQIQANAGGVNSA